MVQLPLLQYLLFHNFYVDMTY